MRPHRLRRRLPRPRRIRQGAEKVAALRPDVDRALKLPLDQRPAGIAKTWNDTATALVDELERVSLAVTDKIRMIDPVIAELVGIKEAAWMLRDGVGLERSLLQEAMGAKKMSVEARVKMAGLRSRANAGWQNVKMLSSRPGVPAEVSRLRSGLCRRKSSKSSTRRATRSRRR